MKIKQHLAICDPEAFIKGKYGYCFSLWGHKTTTEGYIDCGEIEIDVDVDSGKVIQAAVDEINRDIGKATAALDILERRKAELIALPAPEQLPVIPYEWDRPLANGDRKNSTTGVVTPGPERISDFPDDLPRGDL